jgi:hypothetical protein
MFSDLNMSVFIAKVKILSVIIVILITIGCKKIEERYDRNVPIIYLDKIGLIVDLQRETTQQQQANFMVGMLYGASNSYLLYRDIDFCVNNNLLIKMQNFDPILIKNIEVSQPFTGFFSNKGVDFLKFITYKVTLLKGEFPYQFDKKQLVFSNLQIYIKNNGITFRIETYNDNGIFDISGGSLVIQNNKLIISNEFFSDL